MHWVRPELVAEIEFAGLTGDGNVRQAAFKGLREDKPADEVEAEKPAQAGEGRRWPSPSRKRVRPSRAATAARPRGGDGRHDLQSRQAAVAGRRSRRSPSSTWPSYYEAVGDWMLPHIKGRPCSIIRTPDGIDGDQNFFQRHAMAGHVRTCSPRSKVCGDRKPYLQIDRVEAPGRRGPDRRAPSCIPGTASPASPSSPAAWCSTSTPRPTCRSTR